MAPAPRGLPLNPGPEESLGGSICKRGVPTRGKPIEGSRAISSLSTGVLFAASL